MKSIALYSLIWIDLVFAGSLCGNHQNKSVTIPTREVNQAISVPVVKKKSTPQKQEKKPAPKKRIVKKPLQNTDVVIKGTANDINFQNGDKIKPGTLVMLRPEVTVNNANVTFDWEVRYPFTFEQWTTVPETGQVFIAMPKMDLGIQLTVIDWSAKSIVKKRYVLACDVDQGSGGNDDENDNDDDPPPPQPTKEVRGVIILEDNSTIDPDARALQGTVEWRDLGKSMKQALWFDTDAPRAKAFLPYASDVGFPCILLFDSDGQFIGARKLPKTGKALKELVSNGK